MEGQRERTSSRRRQRRKSKTTRSKVVAEPVLIAARRPDSPRLENGLRTVVASAQPKGGGHGGAGKNGAASAQAKTFGSASPDADVSAADVGASSTLDRVVPAMNGALNGHWTAEDTASGLEVVSAGANGAGLTPVTGIRRRAARIVKVTDNVLTPGNREQQLLDRLLRSQGRGAISRAADDLWESKFVAPKRQEVQIQLLEHENETRARDAVFAMAELLQREAPIKRPVLDQRLRRLETSAEDPITRDAAGALRRSMRVHHGGL
jgi:hypothetical protein